MVTLRSFRENVNIIHIKIISSQRANFLQTATQGQTQPSVVCGSITFSVWFPKLTFYPQSLGLRVKAMECHAWRTGVMGQTEPVIVPSSTFLQLDLSHVATGLHEGMGSGRYDPFLDSERRGIINSDNFRINYLVAATYIKPYTHCEDFLKITSSTPNTYVNLSKMCKMCTANLLEPQLSNMKVS